MDYTIKLRDKNNKCTLIIKKSIFLLNINI